MERFRAERGVDRDAEGAEVVGSLPADIQPDPPHQSAQRSRKSTDPERPTEVLHLLDRGRRSHANDLGDLTDRSTDRILYPDREYGLFAAVVTLDRDRRDARRVLVEMRSREFAECASKLGHFRGDEGKGLGKHG